MRQPSEDRALYYRQVRDTVRSVFVPELSSALAVDAAGLVDRILAEFIVEEEDAAALSAEFGGAFEDVLGPHEGRAADRPTVTPQRFHELRADAAAAVARTAASGDAEERRLACLLVDVERRYLERVEALRAAVLADGVVAAGGAPPVSDCSITEEQLTAYLWARFPGSPHVAVDGLAVVPGGRSKETILVSLHGTSDLPGELILRKDRPVGVLQTRAADEFAVIKVVHEFGGVPVPEPFFAEEDGHALGEGTFLVMARVPGHKAGEFFPDLAAPSDHRAEIGTQIAASLARLHSLPLERLVGTRLDPNAPAATATSIVGAVDAIVSRINELTGPPCAAVPLAHRWLVDHVSDVVPAQGACLLQGDFGFHNMLIDRGRVTALVDWEAAAVGPPARELAAAWNAATTLMPWPAFVDAYLEAGGPVESTDPRAIGYYRVFSALGAFMTSRMGGHLFRTGAKRDLTTAHSGLDSHFRCARNLARALADVT